jgi:hypothetical protein
MADSRMADLGIDLSTQTRELDARADKRTQAPDCSTEAVYFCAADRDGVWPLAALHTSEKSGNVA